MTKKGPGRPRDTNVDQRILEAAVDFLANQGYEATNIDAIASAAGVSRPAIYRRFKNKTELIVHAASYAFNELSPTVRASISPKDEVHALLENTVALLTETPAGPIFRNVIPYLDKEPQLAKQANVIGAARRDRLKKTVQKAIDCGELKQPNNLDVWLDTLLGAIYFRFFITDRTLNKRYITSLLDL